MDTIHVCLCFDRIYAVFGLCCIKSILQFNSNVFISILTVNTDEEYINSIIKELFETNCIEVITPTEEYIRELNSIENEGGVSGYLRLLIPKMFSQEDRILYLDVDVLVRGSLTELWATALDNELFAAVPDMGDSSEGREVFNSGVLLLNIPLLNQADFYSVMVKYLQVHRKSLKYSFGDQEAMNKQYQSKWKRLSFKWNALEKDLAKLLPLNKELQSPRILHFAGISGGLVYGSNKSEWAEEWYAVFDGLMKKFYKMEDITMDYLLYSLKKRFCNIRNPAKRLLEQAFKQIKF